MPRFDVTVKIRYCMTVEAEDEDAALDQFFEMSLEDRDGFERDCDCEAIEQDG